MNETFNENNLKEAKSSEDTLIKYINELEAYLLKIT